MNLQSTSDMEKKQLSFFATLKKANLNTQKHFISTLKDISFVLLIFISIFTPIWERYISVYGNISLGDLFNALQVPTSIIMMYEGFLHAPIILNFFEGFVIPSVFYVVILYVVSWSLFNRTHPQEKPLTLLSFTKKTTLPWTIEGLKALLITGVAFTFLIIPGIIKTIHYTFFSFVVFFNPDYKKGNLNCLKHSKKLSKGVRILIFLIVIFPAPLLSQYLFLFIKKLFLSLSEHLIIVYPALALSLYIFCMIVVYLFSLLCFLYFIQENKTREQALAIQMK